ncbi:uncharacterized protein LOC141803724 [Halichoeres trimaculatus]|uniref:uncharacterized protein LOC141803724 n=1 Tax=Halichoeres trimaculatus TaxID=147232 RepID=UPI003D9E0BA4
MSSEGVRPAGEPRLHRFFAWFDPETAAVVTILLGLFQVLLSVPVVFASSYPPSLFVLPLVIGVFVVAGGSVAVANERNPSRLLLRGCVFGNILGLLGASLALALYCYSLSKLSNTVECPVSSYDSHYGSSRGRCPGELLMVHCWSLIFLLLLYDTGAVLMHCVLSVSSLMALKAA